MDSVGLAKAITNYWTEKYSALDEVNDGNNELPIISIAGI